ncbi:UvrD-helicase domain-containing protein, partial [Patescibacteria group bacterium]|nr:UvrD-helicase domain-containing protein [Patescibacteria group bacterium]
KITNGNPPAWMGTFHSVCSKILRIDGQKIGIDPNYSILDSEDSISVIKTIIKDSKMEEKKLVPSSILASIENAKNELISPQEYKSYAKGFYYERVAQIYTLYEKRLRETNNLDFGDLITKTVELLLESQETGEKYKNIFEHILVDEFQDTNKSQYEFCKIISKTHKNLYVVGDMAQSIYSFRGADYKNILNLKKDFPTITEYFLTANYRSTENIVLAASHLIKNNRTNINLNLESKNTVGEKIKIYEAQNEEEEAEFIVQKIIEEDFPKEQVAILYRTNAQSRSIEESLLKRNIPYQIFGGIKFYGRREIKDMICFLKVCINPKNEVAWKRIINIPKKGIGPQGFNKIIENGFDIEYISQKTGINYNNLVKISNNLSPLEFIEKIISETKYINYLKSQNELQEQIQSRIENVEELKTVAKNYATLEAFLEAISLAQDETNTKDKIETKSKITLMTLHASKGLEFETIFITGFEEGVFPHSRSLQDNEQVEEERRLCYVGITRTKSNLYLTYAKKRMLYGNINISSPSRFLTELPKEYVDHLNKGGTTSENSKMLQIDDFFSEIGI